MPRGRKLAFRGFSVYLEEIKQITTQEAAKAIVEDLIEIGPWYSGQFARNWVVRKGDVRVPATVSPGEQVRTNRQEIPLPVIPSLRGTGRKQVGYTIANRVTYRDIAMDLVPGRTKDKGPGSAIAYDWYRDYVQGGNLALTLKQATGIAADNPRIKGFQGPDAPKNK